ncbi:MAG: hypothetical protein GY822_32860 [Deltaproteobacteria bacterium]|nr:hypothetical protein [Deltaproteobacteria bacterium]
MAEFETYLPQVLPSLEGGDPDGDGVNILEEIQIGTLPGDVNSVFSAPATALKVLKSKNAPSSEK